MTEQTEIQPPLPPPEEEGFNITRVIYISLGIFVGIIVLIFALAIWGASANVELFGPVIEVIRDIMIILLVLEGILIILALVVLIAQIARLVNLLQNEIQPILKNTQETVQHAKGTVEFVGKNLTDPVVKANAFAAGVGAFARQVFKLRGALRLDDMPPANEDAAPDASPSSTEDKTP